MHIHEDTFKGAWNELKGEFRKAWAELTDDEIEKIRGERERLFGILQSKYGMSIETARDEVDCIVDRYDDLETLGIWNQVKGQVRETWGQLTDNDVEKIAGRRSRLVGLLEEKYGKSRAEAWREVNRLIGKYS